MWYLTASYFFSSATNISSFNTPHSPSVESTVVGRAMVGKAHLLDYAMLEAAALIRPQP